MQMKLTRNQAERLDAANHQRHQHGHRGDGQIVEQLADGISIGPAVSPQHQDAVGGIDQRHARGEQRGKDQQRPAGDRIG